MAGGQPCEESEKGWLQGSSRLVRDSAPQTSAPTARPLAGVAVGRRGVASYDRCVSEADRRHWDRRHADDGLAPIVEAPPPPPVFARLEHLFPISGSALELACGRGRGAVWLAKRGMDYWGVDVSPVAVGFARELVERTGVASKCRFDVVDLDDGLPDGPPVDLLLCHLFFDPLLDRKIVDRLAPGGLLALAVLSEVEHGPGEFRIKAGGLRRAFGGLDMLDHGEEKGMAWLLARRT